MESNKRACFAFIAASLVNKLIYRRVVEQDTAQSYNIKAYDVTTNAPHFYDQNRGGQIRSTASGFYDNYTGTNVIIKDDTTINGPNGIYVFAVFLFIIIYIMLPIAPTKNANTDITTIF